MRLTIYTDYSLRLLMYLAVNGENLVTIGDVADSYGIAKNHLTKVAHQLGLAGYIETVRGKGGGLRLARLAETIRVSDVLRRTEPDLALVPCLQPVCGPCPIVPACGLHGALREARAAFLAVLDRYTIADLVARRADLRALLAISGPDPARPRPRVVPAEPG